VFLTEPWSRLSWPTDADGLPSLCPLWTFSPSLPWCYRRILSSYLHCWNFWVKLLGQLRENWVVL